MVVKFQRVRIGEQKMQVLPRSPIEEACRGLRCWDHLLSCVGIRKSR